MQHSPSPNSTSTPSTVGLTLASNMAAESIRHSSEGHLKHFATIIGEIPFKPSMLNILRSKLDSFVELASDMEFFESPFSVFNELGNILTAAADAATQLLPDPELAQPALLNLKQRITSLARKDKKITETSIRAFTTALNQELPTATNEMLVAYTQRLNIRNKQQQCNAPRQAAPSFYPAGTSSYPASSTYRSFQPRAFRADGVTPLPKNVCWHVVDGDCTRPGCPYATDQHDYQSKGTRWVDRGGNIGPSRSRASQQLSSAPK